MYGSLTRLEGLNITTVVTKAWCLRMAALEGDQEIKAAVTVLKARRQDRRARSVEGQHKV